MSSNLSTLCSMTGLGKRVSFFDFDWKLQRWNLLVVLGAMLGGFVAVHYMSDASNVDINPKTIAQLAQLGIDAPNGKLMPNVLFGNDIFQSPKMIFILIIGGVLIGFGTRYAGGCTSGHAFSASLFKSCNRIFYWRIDYGPFYFTLTFLIMNCEAYHEYLNFKIKKHE
jgi:hypothetical protein